MKKLYFILSIAFSTVALDASDRVSLRDQDNEMKSAFRKLEVKSEVENESLKRAYQKLKAKLDIQDCHSRYIKSICSNITSCRNIALIKFQFNAYEIVSDFSGIYIKNPEENEGNQDTVSQSHTDTTTPGDF